MTPTHNRLRRPLQVFLIAESMRRDGWVGPPVLLARVEGVDYIHDGHHRLIAAGLAGIEPQIRVEEYSMVDYVNPNPPRWMTPFDPRFEVRVPEFFSFKNEAAGKSSEWILSQKERYAEPRVIHDLEGLALQSGIDLDKRRLAI